MNNNIKFNIEEIKKIDNGKQYLVTLELPIQNGWFEEVYFILKKGNDIIPYKLKHKKNENGKVIFEGEIPIETRAIYNYYFSYLQDGIRMFFKKENIVEDNRIIPDEMWKMSVNFDVPEWAKGKIMYHIFVDRFKRGNIDPLVEMPRRNIYKTWDEELKIGPDQNGIWNNDFYGGDLKGIIEKLDYIQSLGASIVYLSPIVHSQSNHRYDSADYENVDPYVGNNEDLKLLCQEAHKRGMKIVLDAVFNHTGNDSKYFNEYGTFDEIGAYQSKESKYFPFYKSSQYGENTSFEYWWGMTNLPVCNGYSKEWQDYIVGKNGIIDQWFKLGIDGLRLDVADELTDDFIEKIRIAVKRNKVDGFILGEVWKNPMRMNRGYIESGKGMDSVMNYSLIDALIRYFKYGDVDKISYIIQDIKREYPDDTINTLMNFTSTHDISRAINIFGANEFQEQGEWAWNPKNNDLNYCKNYKLTNDEYKFAKALYEAYSLGIATLPGIMSIFYGDEVGVEGLGNLANRKPFPWEKEDQELLEHFRKIGNLKISEKFLETASLNVLEINPKCLMFERVGENEKALVAINRTGEEQNIEMPDEYRDGKTIYSLKKSRFGHLGPYGGLCIKKEGSDKNE